MFDISAFMQGFVLGLGMFVCPGPKDFIILRQALDRRSTVELLAVGVGSDALLIALGVLGVSAALQRAPQAQQLALWIGVGLMLAHATHSLWRLATDHHQADRPPRTSNDRTALWLTSFLNPVAWMDTVLVIGTAGAALPRLSQPSYGVGAVMASAVWFTLLTAGAARAAPWMAGPRAHRVLDLLAAAAMTGVAGYVASGLL